ncbi:MAG: hypothetical protein J0L52_10590 [Caulobacterales bacterium]|nr:hypothetical protein [Caulobacterales bacterium]
MDTRPAPSPTGLSIFSLLAIIVTGLIPIWGVLNYDWNAIQVVVLFWLETLVFGIFAWMRVRDTERLPGSHEPFHLRSFFPVHYGLFWLVHGILTWVLVLVFMPAGGWDAAWSATFADRSFWMALIGVGLLQTMSHWRDWARPEAWRAADPSAEIRRPYARVGALHLAVIGGFWVISLSGSSRELVILLCGAKLVIDAAVALWQAGFKVRFEAVR